MRKYLLRFMTILAIATPLALAGCHSGGDEHPGDSAGSQSSDTGGAEHPGGGAE